MSAKRHLAEPIKLKSFIYFFKTSENEFPAGEIPVGLWSG